MDLIRGALESLDSILSSARRYKPSYSSDFRQELVEGLTQNGDRSFVVEKDSEGREDSLGRSE